VRTPGKGSNNRNLSPKFAPLVAFVVFTTNEISVLLLARGCLVGAGVVGGGAVGVGVVEGFAGGGCVVPVPTLRNMIGGGWSAFSMLVICIRKPVIIEFFGSESFS
jgi:hypothetical protein